MTRLSFLRWLDFDLRIWDRVSLKSILSLARPNNAWTAIRRRRRRHTAGFTLIEVVVALAILALSTAVLLDQISNGMAQVGRARAMSEAGMLAQSLLARVGTELPLQRGEFTGQVSNRYRWELRVEPNGEVIDLRVWPVGAYTVVAEVFWREGLQEHSIALRTLRIGPKDATR